MEAAANVGMFVLGGLAVLAFSYRKAWDRYFSRYLPWLMFAGWLSFGAAKVAHGTASDAFTVIGIATLVIAFASLLLERLAAAERE